MDIYTEITERIIEQMEHGIIPWQKPWVGSDSTVSHATGRSYSILNQILLGKPGEYISFNQCAKEGGKIKKGAKSRMVVFWKILEDVDAETGDVKKIPLLKYSRVFHIDDCEGIKAKYTAEDKTFDNKPIEHAQTVLDQYLNREGIKLEFVDVGGAYYRPAQDTIHLPALEKFVSSEAFYDTAFHECVHSTGAEKRLDRTGITGWANFGSDVYSKEELIAEIGACAIMNILGLETTTTFRNNAAYIQNWLTALKNNKRLLVGASTAADKAVRFLLGTETEG